MFKVKMVATGCCFFNKNPYNTVLALYVPNEAL